MDNILVGIIVAMALLFCIRSFVKTYRGQGAAIAAAVIAAVAVAAEPRTRQAIAVRASPLKS